MYEPYKNAIKNGGSQCSFWHKIYGEFRDYNNYDQQGFYSVQ